MRLGKNHLTFARADRARLRSPPTLSRALRETDDPTPLSDRSAFDQMPDIGEDECAVWLRPVRRAGPTSMLSPTAAPSSENPGGNPCADCQRHRNGRDRLFRAARAIMTLLPGLQQPNHQPLREQLAGIDGAALGL